MEGPTGGYRPRTAGDRPEASGGTDGVRDWQKNTWFGPAPVNSNPFDEPGDAPELKESRSENVNERLGNFWNAPDLGYQQGGAETQKTRTHKDTKDFHSAGTAARKASSHQHPPPQKSGTDRKPAHLRRFLILLLCLTAVILVLRYAVFTVREIHVTGNNVLSAEEVIRRSGIRQGDSILSIDEKKVEERILTDYRLQFRYLVRELPGTVTLAVREREPCCWLTYCGIMYVMDKNRMVLYESENPAEQPVNLVEIKGLEVRSNTIVGQYITLGSEVQQSVFSELFLEMKVLGCTDQIAEADISNTESILLATREGYTARLGSRENLHAKLRSLLLVQEELKQLGQQGGTISLINPESPIYTP